MLVVPADVKARQESAVDLALRPKPKQPKVTVTAKEITIKEQIQFALDSAVILPESFGILTEIADTVIRHPEIKRVEVQGHTDNSGTPGAQPAAERAARRGGAGLAGAARRRHRPPGRPRLRAGQAARAERHGRRIVRKIAGSSSSSSRKTARRPLRRPPRASRLLPRRRTSFRASERLCRPSARIYPSGGLDKGGGRR